MYITRRGKKVSHSNLATYSKPKGKLAKQEYCPQTGRNYVEANFQIKKNKIKNKGVKLPLKPNSKES